MQLEVFVVWQFKLLSRTLDFTVSVKCLAIRLSDDLHVHYLVFKIDAFLCGFSLKDLQFDQCVILSLFWVHKMMCES